MVGSGRAQPGAGFTLLELMVALALTSLVSLVAYTSLNLGLKAVRGSQTTAESLQELRVAQTILQRSVSSAVRGSMENSPYFEGDASEIKFFTLVPLEAHNLGGVYHWRILAGEDKSGGLVLAVEQSKNVNWARDPKDVEVRQVLLSNLKELRFAYGVSDKEYKDWEGKKTRSLPDWVRIYFTLKHHQPQVWIIPLHVSDYKTGTS